MYGNTDWSRDWLLLYVQWFLFTHLLCNVVFIVLLTEGKKRDGYAIILLCKVDLNVVV